ncbi:MAG: Gfo/Idh/MocA family oxidoreductase [Gemmatimonadota bacterium]|nr:Gfo/Idh/MocA family oxidoreductase [Gemmatimonadota bacterium]
MSDLKAAVIGCGGHAQSHLQMIADEPRLRLAGIAELDEDRLRRNRADWAPEQAFADYREMLDTVAPDVVYVVTNPGHLLPIVLDCLERGIHTSVEKSPGMNVDETAQMARAARDSAGKGIVSFNRRYYPHVLAVRRRIQGRGGAVHVAATYNKPLTRFKAATPDPVICDAIHHVDLIRWLAGSGPEEAAIPVEVQGMVQDGERPVCHRHNAVVRFDTGAFGVLMSHYGVGYRIQRAEVHAEDLSVYLDLTRAPTVEGYERGEPFSVGDDEIEAVGGAGFNEVVHFVDCILEDRTPLSTLDDAVQTMRLCEAIRAGHQGTL